MAGTISVYSFQDPQGYEYGSFTTQDFEEARNYAMNGGLRVVENVYEWAEALPVEGADFTTANEDADPEIMIECFQCRYQWDARGPDDPCPECGYIAATGPRGGLV